MEPRHLLYGDERVLWEGAPPRGVQLRPRDAIAVPFFLLWTGVAVLYEVAAPDDAAGWFMRLWGVPFVAIGAYMAVGRLLHDAYVRGRQRYRVTDRRVLVERTGRGADTRSLAIGRLPLIAMTERPDGSGDLRFEPVRTAPGRGGRPVEIDRDAPALAPTVQFLGIADVARVHAVIEQAAAARVAAAEPSRA